MLARDFNVHISSLDRVYTSKTIHEDIIVSLAGHVICLTERANSKSNLLCLAPVTEYRPDQRRYEIFQIVKYLFK